LEFLKQLEDHAVAVGGRVVLAEGQDPRIIEAAGELATRQAINVTVLCPKDERRGDHDDLEGRGVAVRDPASDPDRDALVSYLLERRAHKGLSEADAHAAVTDPLYFASLLVATDAADASVGGAVRTTADTVRAALHCIGPGAGLKTVSSAFVMVHPDERWGDRGVMVFSDCAVLPDPNSEQLAEIAISAAHTFQSIVGGTPRVALLSFSTKGSADHPLVDKVSGARAEL
jgi:phosphate acetyltransferase